MQNNHKKEVEKRRKNKSKMKSLFIPETWADVTKLSQKDIKEILDNYEKVLRLKFELENHPDAKLHPMRIARQCVDYQHIKCDNLHCKNDACVLNKFWKQ